MKREGRENIVKEKSEDSVREHGVEGEHGG